MKDTLVCPIKQLSNFRNRNVLGLGLHVGNKIYGDSDLSRRHCRINDLHRKTGVFSFPDNLVLPGSQKEASLLRLVLRSS